MSWKNCIKYENGVIQYDLKAVEDYLEQDIDLYTDTSFGSLFNDDSPIEDQLLAIYNVININKLQEKVEKSDSQEEKERKFRKTSLIYALNAIVFQAAVLKEESTNNTVTKEDIVNIILPSTMEIISSYQTKRIQLVRLGENTEYYNSAGWSGFYNTNNVLTIDHQKEVVKKVFKPALQCMQFRSLSIILQNNLEMEDLNPIRVLYNGENGDTNNFHCQYYIGIVFRQRLPSNFVSVSYINMAHILNSYWHYYQLKYIGKPYASNGRNNLKPINNDLFKKIQYIQKGDSYSAFGIKKKKKNVVKKKK